MIVFCIILIKIIPNTNIIWYRIHSFNFICAYSFTKSYAYYSIILFLLDTSINSSKSFVYKLNVIKYIDTTDYDGTNW